MENIYLKTKDKKTCNGCTACMYVCPKGAIDMEEDKEGFIYPAIDEKKCVKCGKCLRVCSNYEYEVERAYDIYAGINSSEDTLLKSTSGGAFTAFVTKLFKESNSVCYGATYNENLDVVHMRAETLKDAEKFRGAKYVRSSILDTYAMIKKDLECGRKVLFTGTPCQCHGLTVYLNKIYPNLILCDIICHSNPSPKVFGKYIKALSLKENSNVKKFTFRSKESGWSNATPIVEFENGKVYTDTIYQRAFSRVLISRPSCHDCKFIKPYNFADITIGDFWGVDKLTNIKGYEKGISLILANTKLGKEFLEDIDGIKLYKLDGDIDVFKYNHNKPEKPHRNREKFFKNIDKYDGVEFIKFMNKMSRERFLRRVVTRFKKK